MSNPTLTDETVATGKASKASTAQPLDRRKFLELMTVGSAAVLLAPDAAHSAADSAQAPNCQRQSGTGIGDIRNSTAVNPRRVVERGKHR